MKIKFLIMLGDIKTSFRTRGRRGVGNEYEPSGGNGQKGTIVDIMDEGPDKEGEREDERIPEWAVMCEPAPESAYHSLVFGGGIKVIALKLLTREP
jgi:hypothetical protein